MKFRVNHASVAKGPHGDFGTLLVNPEVAIAGVDSVKIRTTADVATEVKKAIAKYKNVGEVLTVAAETTEVVFADGHQGPREENWTTEDGTAVSQVALYLRFASTPDWGHEVKKNDRGNLGDL
jgi:hypothetical protein